MWCGRQNVFKQLRNNKYYGYSYCYYICTLANISVCVLHTTVPRGGLALENDTPKKSLKLREKLISFNNFFEPL